MLVSFAKYADEVLTHILIAVLILKLYLTQNMRHISLKGLKILCLSLMVDCISDWGRVFDAALFDTVAIASIIFTVTHKEPFLSSYIDNAKKDSFPTFKFALIISVALLLPTWPSFSLSFFRMLCQRARFYSQFTTYDMRADVFTQIYTIFAAFWHYFWWMVVAMDCVIVDCSPTSAFLFPILLDVLALLIMCRLAFKKEDGSVEESRLSDGNDNDEESNVSMNILHRRAQADKDPLQQPLMTVR